MKTRRFILALTLFPLPGLIAADGGDHGHDDHAAHASAEEAAVHDSHTPAEHDEPHAAHEEASGHHDAHAEHAAEEHAEESAEPAAIYTPDWEQLNTLEDELEFDPSLDHSRTEIIERRYVQQLTVEGDPKVRQKILMDLAAILQQHNNLPKLAAVYEKYVELYPNEPNVPELYMRLGLIYREMGSFEMALSKFYSVLNASLSVERDQIEAYRLLSLKAQLEIADTHYAQGHYEEASRLFLRLRKVNLSTEDRAKVDFKYAYAQYLLENYATVISNLIAFIRDYPENPLAAESHFLLANAYKQLGQPREAVRQTLKLLRVEAQRNSPDESVWLYWKKRTGNQLANEFYEQSDFLSALKIYQAMAPLSDAPAWQWPVVYQIGLCFERLRMFPKAREAYDLITQNETASEDLPEEIRDLKQLAQWRYEHLQWLEQTETELGILLPAATSDPESDLDTES